MKDISLQTSELKKLKKQAKKDAFIHAFQNYRNGQAYPPIDNKIKIVEDNRPLIVSAFIFNELRKYNLSREKLKNKKLFIINLHDGINHYFRILPYYRAVQFLEGQISKTIAEIDSFNKQYNTDRAKLESDCKTRALNNNPEIIAIYTKQIEDLKQTYAKKTIRQRTYANKVISEKKRVMEEMRSMLTFSFSRQYMRISCYYSYAQQFNPDLLADCITETELLRICNTDIMPEFNEEQEKLATIQKSLNL